MADHRLLDDGSNGVSQRPTGLLNSTAFAAILIVVLRMDSAAQADTGTGIAIAVVLSMAAVMNIIRNRRLRRASRT